MGSYAGCDQILSLFQASMSEALLCDHAVASSLVDIHDAQGLTIGSHQTLLWKWLATAAVPISLAVSTIVFVLRHFETLCHKWWDVMEVGVEGCSMRR